MVCDYFPGLETVLGGTAPQAEESEAIFLQYDDLRQEVPASRGRLYMETLPVPLPFFDTR